MGPILFRIAKVAKLPRRYLLSRRFILTPPAARNLMNPTVTKNHEDDTCRRPFDDVATCFGWSRGRTRCNAPHSDVVRQLADRQRAVGKVGPRGLGYLAPREQMVDRNVVATVDREREPLRLAGPEFAQEPSQVDGSTAIESTTTLAFVASAVVDDEADHPDERAPAPTANSPSASDKAIEHGEAAAVGGGFNFAWDFEEIANAGSPAPLAASQARLEWAALGESLEPRSPTALWRRLGESNARGWRPAMVVASRDNTNPERADFLDATEIGDGDEPIPPLDDLAPAADLIAPDALGPDSAPEDDTPEGFEPVACRIDQWLADAPTPTAGQVSTCEVGSQEPKAFLRLDLPHQESAIAQLLVNK